VNALANKFVVATLVLAGIAARADSAPAKPAAEAAGNRQVSGRVLAPDGKPVAGAKLFTYILKTPRPANYADNEILPLGATDADGRFSVTVPLISKDLGPAYLMAQLPGFGVDWLRVDRETDPVPEQTLRLSEDVPITGRVVDAGGRPVSGVSVTIAAIHAPAGRELDAYLSEWKTIHSGFVWGTEKLLPAPLSRVVGATATDRDGRFTLRGAGAGRGVDLLISGAGIARANPHVITRRGLDPGPYNETEPDEITRRLRLAIPSQLLYGPDFTFVAEPGKAVEGMVTDAATGAPVPGCRVHETSAKGAFASDRTNAQGRYRLDGLAKSTKGYQVAVSPPQGTTYLDQRARVRDAEGDAPARLDIRLGKGAVVTGRVVDKQTGQGVRSILRVVPLLDNKFVGTKPEFGADSAEKEFALTDPDGRFRVVVLPGSELILARAMGGKSDDGHPRRYRRAVPDPGHKELFHTSTGGGWAVATAGSGTKYLSLEHVAKVIDAKEDGETTVELSVDPGLTAKVAVQDADGRPLAGARVSGLTEEVIDTRQISEATATVYALDPDQPRTLVVCHPDKKLGGTVAVRGDEKQPVVARLRPLGRVTGRAIDADGGPLPGTEISLYSTDRNAFRLYELLRRDRRVVADKDGHFAIEFVVPDIPFRLVFRKGEKLYHANQPIEDRSLKSGETIDVGDVTLKPIR
jgi:protocatechuate 3,4-dioxygenase beta subunit